MTRLCYLCKENDGDRVPIDDKCQDCSKGICEAHSITCNSCERLLCEECGESCEKCDAEICESCNKKKECKSCNE